MILERLAHMASDNQATLTASGTSVAGSLSVAAALPPPDSLLTLLPYLATVLGPAIVLLVNRVLAAKAAGKRARAASVEARARVKLAAAKEKAADADTTNDAEAKAEAAEAEAALDQAAVERAEADALEALRARSGHE